MHRLMSLRSRENSVGIATGYGLDSRFESLQGQTGSLAHTTPYPMGTGGSFPGAKADGS